MKTRTGALIATLAMGMTLAAPNVGQAQIRDADRIRDRIHQMDQQIQQMDRIRDRIHQLDQALTRQMDRVQDQIRQRDQDHDRLMQQIRDQTQRAQAEQDRIQQRLQEQDQLRQHQELREMNWELGDMAQNTHRNLERTRAMMGEGLFSGDPQLEREMEQLQAHWRVMGDQLDQGLQAMERMQQRLSSGVTTNVR